MTEFLSRRGDTLLAECALHLFGDRFAGPLRAEGLP